MRQWPWIAIAVAVVALAALIYPLVQTQKRLKLVQSELGRANEQAKPGQGLRNLRGLSPESRT